MRGAKLTAYPGSPLIARALLRPQDRMTACELEAGAHRQLVAALRRDRQARVVKIDGWTALPAYVPPQERRGVVLVDPPFEQRTSSTGSPQASRPPMRNGRPGSSCSGIRSRMPARRLALVSAWRMRCWQRTVARPRHPRKDLAERYLADRIPDRPRDPYRCADGRGVDRRQPTVDAGARAWRRSRLLWPRRLGAEGQGRFRIGRHNL